MLLPLVVLPLTSTAAPILDEFTAPDTAFVGYQVPVNITILIQSQTLIDPVIIVHYLPPGATENKSVIMYNFYDDVWIGQTSFQMAEGEIIWQDVQVNDEVIYIQGETTDLVLEDDDTDAGTWAFVIVVLIVVFVIIEMSFKPGRYRPRRPGPPDEPDSENGDEKTDDVTDAEDWEKEDSQ